jgi:RHS repeat-associated protein
VVGSDRNPHQYEGLWGYYTDESPASSRLYVRMRHLRTDQGRWMSRDPLGAGDDWNLYRYVMDNPTALADPSGLQGLRDLPKVGSILKGTRFPSKLPPTTDSILKPIAQRVGTAGAGAAEEGAVLGLRSLLGEALGAIGLGITLYQIYRDIVIIEDTPIEQLLYRIQKGEFSKTNPRRKRLECLVRLYFDRDHKCITIFNRGGSYGLLDNIRALMRLMNSTELRADPACDPDSLEIHHMPQDKYIAGVRDPLRGNLPIRVKGEAPGVGMLILDHYDTRTWGNRGNPPPYNATVPDSCPPIFIGPRDFEGRHANRLQLEDMEDVLRGGIDRRFPNTYLRGVAEARLYSRTKWPSLFLSDPRESALFRPGEIDWWQKLASKEPRLKKRWDPNNGPC